MTERTQLTNSSSLVEFGWNWDAVVWHVQDPGGVVHGPEDILPSEEVDESCSSLIRHRSKLEFPRFRGHLTWRDNASGGGHDEEEKTAIYA